jgi:hypothetical protein
MVRWQFWKKSKRKCLIEMFSRKNIHEFLSPKRANIGLFLLIVAIHYFLNLGLGYFSKGYNYFVSLLYGAFNLPLLLLNISINSMDVTSSYSFAVLIVPLIIHLIYWYIVGSFVASIIRQNDKGKRYKNAFIMLLVYFAFVIIAYFFIAFFYLPIRMI